MRFLLIPLCAMALARPVWAEDAVDYARTIKPVLKARCFACHGALKQQAGLRLDSVALIAKGGESGLIVTPGDSAASPLLKRVSATDDAERMPPEGEPLKPEEIAALRDWVAQGAKGPADDAPERDPRDHWAFNPPTRSTVPIDETGWSANPIDAFISERHRKHGLTPQPRSDRRVWLRRVSLDLIGLPPTKQELDAFLADDSADAIDKVVTRLLDSPQYGERWGRHWMDIWRYSDWWGLGEDARNSQKHIWHWRDWIVESLNTDKGYDQMLREMLAADELYPGDEDRLRAGGFLSRQYFKFNRTSWMDETIEHTAKAMLGLTFNCAKCHDHKYDPFTQLDYYRFRAIFEPYQIRLDAVGRQIDFEMDGIPRPFDCNLDTKTFLHIRGDDRNPDTSRVIEPAIPAFLSRDPIVIEPVSLPAVAFQPGLRPLVVDAHLAQAEKKIVEKRAEVETARKKLAEAEQREALATAAVPADKPQSEGGSIVRDDFAMSRPDVWDLRDGSWEYAEGKLRQSQEGDVRGVLRLKQVPPEDFEAKLKYVVTGGQKWKSVGIAFDGTETNELLAYLSAYAEGSKAQFAYKKGDYLYPADGAQARPIELNKPYELTVRVRGTLINMSVNGEHSVAFRVPLPRQRGYLQLITYDAMAEFMSFELNSLPSGLALVEPKTGPAATDSQLPVDQAKLALAIAQKSLAWADLQPDTIRAKAVADHAKYQSPRPDNFIELARAAAKAERIGTAAKAEEDVLRAELDVMRAAADKKKELEAKLDSAKAALETARKAIDEPSETFASLRGALKALESNLETEDSRQKPFPETSTGRRSALARWVSDSRHPLTARVAINHIWSRHFGRPLVPTVFDFGRKGTAPTHPELLDWLAMELMEGGRTSEDSHSPWGMKRIHRLIVTSNTYRMSSSSAAAPRETLANDPDNRFYWRMNPIRMESQVVRDSLLHLAGELDRTMSGPSIPTSNETSRRRSLYFVHSNIDHQKFLSMFDDASVLDCYRRAESIVPQQALALENSPLASDMSKMITDNFLAVNTGATDQEFIRHAFLLVLGVEPSQSEQAAVIEALGRFEELARRANRNDPAAQARISVILALLNHNDFVTIR